MRTQRYLVATLTVTFALSAFPARALTQTAVKSALTVQPMTPAEELEQQAAVLHDEIARYAEAARLYREAASRRSSTDPRAVESLSTAAHLFHYANRLFDARKTMEQAAQRALARGDVIRASIAYLEAALFAYKQGNLAESGRLGRNALKLTSSPLLTEEQRGSILSRLRAQAAVAALVK